jgi:hypothetical protein
MLLSALTLAAMLQIAPVATPMATSVVIPQAASAVGLKGYLSEARPAGIAQSVGELSVPVPKAARVARAKAAYEGRAQRFVPSFKRKPLRSMRGFVRNPQMVNCDSNGLTPAGGPETQQLQPLSRMPRAHGERAVARLVDGCPVAVTIAQQTPAP